MDYVLTVLSQVLLILYVHHNFCSVTAALIFGTQMVLYDYQHGILNRMFSQETITDVDLYQTPDKYCRQRSPAIINQRQNTQFL